MHEKLHWPDQLRAYRRKNFLSQENLAEQLEVDQTTVSRWERGIVKPTLKQQAVISRLINEDVPNQEDFLKFLLEFVPMGTVVVDTKTHAAVAASRQFLQTHQLDDADLRGMPRQLLNPEELQAELKEFCGVPYVPRDVAAAAYEAKMPKNGYANRSGADVQISVVAANVRFSGDQEYLVSMSKPVAGSQRPQPIRFYDDRSTLADMVRLLV